MVKLIEVPNTNKNENKQYFVPLKIFQQFSKLKGNQAMLKYIGRK